jgi:hypothetical protein
MLFLLDCTSINSLQTADCYSMICFYSFLLLHSDQITFFIASDNAAGSIIYSEDNHFPSELSFDISILLSVIQANIPPSSI